MRLFYTAVLAVFVNSCVGESGACEKKTKKNMDEASKNPELDFNIINLFLIADLLTLSITVPVLLGLYPFITPCGVLAGCACGLLFIMGIGWVEFGTFIAALKGFSGLLCTGELLHNGLSQGGDCRFSHQPQNFQADQVRTVKSG